MQKSPLLFFSLWWLVWSAVQTVLLFQFNIDLRVCIIDAGVSNLLLALPCYALSFVLRSYQPQGSRSFYLIVWVLILALFSVSSAQGLLKIIVLTDSFYLTFLNSSFYIRLWTSTLMIGTSVLLTWMWNFLNERKEDEHRKTEAQRLVREAELIGLRQQLQPHFLFNTLNSISALTMAEPEKARQMVQQLSDFFRMTLNRNETQFVTLEEELKYLQLYLDIEKVRFGYRLETLINCEEESLKKKIPALLLQPIVENAIKFGLYETLDKICIKVKAMIQDEQLIIKVENPYDYSISNYKTGTGFGLNGIRRRLSLLFFRNDLLQIASTENDFIVTLTIPQHA